MTRLVLLTGGTGFVGRQVLAALLSRGESVRALVRPGRRDSITAMQGSLSVVETDDVFAESQQRLADFCEGVDTIVHAAWFAEPGKYLQSPLNLSQLNGTLELARASAMCGVRRFVGIGTCFEYDLNTREPLRVESPLRPTTPYAGAKAAAYMALSQWLPAQHVSFAWCRLFYLFGENEDPRRLVPYLRARLQAGETAELTSGTQVRDFIDVAEAGSRIADVALGSQDGAVNICSGRAITVRQLAERIADEYGRRDLLRFGARADNQVDPPFVVGVP